MPTYLMPVLFLASIGCALTFAPRACLSFLNRIAKRLGNRIDVFRVNSLWSYRIAGLAFLAMAVWVANVGNVPPATVVPPDSASTRELSPWGIAFLSVSFLAFGLLAISSSTAVRVFGWDKRMDERYYRTTQFEFVMRIVGTVGAILTFTALFDLP